MIGTLAHREATEQGIDTLVSTGDKDMAQLVNRHVTLVNTMTDTVLDEQGVQGKFGVRPDQIVDFLALTGDSVDNIPGVPKCGPKTAAKWLGQFGTLDEVIARADDVQGKIGESLRASLDILPLSRILTRIKTDVAFGSGRRICSHMTVTPQSCASSTTSSIHASAGQPADEGPARGRATRGHRTGRRQLRDHPGRTLWITGWSVCPSASVHFDTETTSLDYMRARVVGVSLR